MAHCRTGLSFLLSACLFCTPLSAFADIEWLDVSGFGRIVAGHLDGEENLGYLEYSEGDTEFDSQSLLGLQFDLKLTEKLGLSTQLLGHTGENRQSGIEWLYLNYKPVESVTLKFGKLRIPLFSYSDVIDVGYAYPWITPPRQVYVDYLFSNYDGINVQYSTAIDDTNLSLEVYWGQFDDDLTVIGDTSRVKVDDLRGAVFKGGKGPFGFRLAYNEGDVDPFNQDFEDLSRLLRAADFFQSADSLVQRGRVTAVHAGLNYTTLDFFAEGEWIRVRSKSIVIPDIKSFFVTAGYSFNELTFFGTAAKSMVDSSEGVNDIPMGILPQLDALSNTFNQVFTTVNANQDDLVTLSLGARWDFRHNMALKVETTRILGETNTRSFFTAPPSAGESNQATLYQMALEWVF